jgi:hypothetical protein
MTLGEVAGTAAGMGGATDGAGVALVEEPAGGGLCARSTPPKVPVSTIIIANTLFNVVNMR